MKKLSVRLLAAALSVCAVISAAGCSANNTSSADATPSATESTASKPENDTPAQIRDISSMELIKEMKVGWNLGNTLDAGNSSKRGAEPASIEMSWGNPLTTFEMVKAVKDQGFNVIRVPVTWDWSTGDAPDYKISDEWMNRVKEVVSYGIDNGMFVILNIHHETWHDPVKENYEQIKDRFVKVWTQIGTAFQNYDEHLIFESLNEPRLRNTSLEWNGGDEDSREVVNMLNADFVSTIRSLGGNNKLRHLMMPGYAAACTDNVLKAIKLPDENDNKLIVSVHAYIPYGFALQDKGGSKWLGYKSGSVNDINTLHDNLKSLFIDKNIAVIIGEFGARSKDNDEYRTEYAKYFVTKMRDINVPCVWWDNGAFSGNGELFGLIDRNTLKWRYQSIADALTDAANDKFTIEELTKQPEEQAA